MDNFVPQTGGLEVREGHEESDLSIRGIVAFGIALAVAGAFAFVLMKFFLVGLERFETWMYPTQLTPAEQQLQAERAAAAPGAAQKEGGTGRTPEWHGRGEMEEHLGRTFPTPRLQYDDAREMEIFRGSEDDWLKSAGRDAQGNIHIPVERAMDLLVKNGLPPSGPFVPPTLPPAVSLVPAPAAQHK
jgi:hypothetical protein